MARDTLQHPDTVRADKAGRQSWDDVSIRLETGPLVSII